jgi:hypothetical protein
VSSSLGVTVLQKRLFLDESACDAAAVLGFAPGQQPIPSVTARDAACRGRQCSLVWQRVDVDRPVRSDR